MKINALIPAYNEEETIGSIINTLNQINEINEIIVIDDGSSDLTAEVAKKATAQVIQFEKNKGKGAALQRGIEYIEADIILMLDGDLIGLNTDHVYSLLKPILDDKADMTVGVFNDGRGITDLAQFVTPHLSGQRAIRVSILDDIKNLDEAGFGVEISINKYVKEHGRLNYVDLPELTHVLKEEKMGLARGMKARAKMYWEIIRTLFIKNIKN